MNIVRYMTRFAACERGATAIEYSVIAAFLSVLLATSIFLLGDELEALWIQLAEDILPAL